MSNNATGDQIELSDCVSAFATMTNNAGSSKEAIEARAKFVRKLKVVIVELCSKPRAARLVLKGKE